MEALADTKERANKAANDAYAEAKRLIAEGKQVVISAKEFEDDRSLAQNAFYWAVVLPAISEQARIDGKRYTVDAWHELGKRLFLGFKVERVRVAGRKPSVIRRLRSTTDLTVKQFAKYVEELQAYAVTDFGVEFPT